MTTNTNKTATFSFGPSTTPEKDRFISILNSRPYVTLEEAREGMKLRCKITSAKHDHDDERVVSRSTGEIAKKDLYSFNINKANVAKSKYAQDAYAKAIALENAGQTEEARKAFDKLLNDIQLNAGFIVRENTVRHQKDHYVDVFITTAMVADRNPLTKERLATSHESIVVESMAALASVTAKKDLAKHDYFAANVEIVDENAKTLTEEIAAEIAAVINP